MPTETPMDNVRRSERVTTRKDYKEIHQGLVMYVTEGNTVVSAHMTNDNHQEKDINLEIVAREDNWWKRGIQL